MGPMLIVAAGMTFLASALFAAVRLRNEPRRAARAILLGLAVCILLVSAGIVISTLT